MRILCLGVQAQGAADKQAEETGERQRQERQETEGGCTGVSGSSYQGGVQVLLPLARLPELPQFQPMQGDDKPTPELQRGNAQS
jgi:hypothetical protein